MKTVWVVTLPWDSYTVGKSRAFKTEKKALAFCRQAKEEYPNLFPEECFIY